VEGCPTAAEAVSPVQEQHVEVNIERQAC
jgi:hypothetical protein